GTRAQGPAGTTDRGIPSAPEVAQAGATLAQATGTGRSRLVVPASRGIGENRQRPAPADGCKSNAQAEDKGGDQVEVVVDLQVTQGQVEYGYQQRHAGVQLLAQYHGGAVTEDVAQDAAEDPRGHAGHDHHRGGVAQLQRDIAADHGEGDKTHGI